MTSLRASDARHRKTPKTIDEYIERCSPEVQPLLRRVRATIRKAAPDAIETISYGIPAFKLRRILVYFAAFEHHIGLYPPAKGNAAIEKAAAGVLGDSLVRLRDEMSREFPRALEFRRPGFDETGS